MYKLSWLICVVLPLMVHGQVKTIGTPYIYNYPKSVYKGGTQNWGIAQDQNDFMYFANNDGVLRFDGLHWDVIQVSRSSPVRSICIDNMNKIYVGLFNDFGVLKPDSKGELKFSSLRNLLSEEITDFDIIWKIYDIPQGIVFQSYNYLFLLRNDKIEVIKPKSRFHFSFYVSGRFFLHEPGVGLFEYVNGMIGKVPWADELTNKEIRTILGIQDNHLLIGTNSDGIYKFENGKLQKWDTPANEMIKNYKLYSAAKSQGNNFVFGTILSGIIIADANGKVMQHINRKEGLQNNTILSVFSDKNKNLWLGLDNGIDYVEINSPVSYITEKEGLGTGYCAKIFKGNLYLGTNQGLFVKSFENFSNDNEQFQLVENTAGQAWSLHIFDGQLICGLHKGTFVINGSQAKQISNREGGWNYIKLNNHPDMLLGGNYSGLQLFKKGINGWEFFKDVRGFNESSRFLIQDSDGPIWISHGEKGIFRIKLNSDLDSVEFYKLYDSNDGLPSNEHNILFEFNAAPYISTIEGIYKYDKTNDKFVVAEYVNRLFNFDGRLKTLETDKSGNIWFIAENESGVFRLNEDLTYSKITSPFKQLDDKYVTEFEFIYPYNNDHVLIGLDNGFAHYLSKFTKSYSREFHSYITKVEIPYIDSTLILINKNFSTRFEFPYHKNSFRFHYTAPKYENPGKLSFSFFLENYSESWSNWSPDIYRDFTNLPEGDYVFKVKAKNIYEVESKIAAISFTILPPWFRSRVAYFSYLILIIVVVWLTVRYILSRRLKAMNKEKQKYQLELQKKDEEFRRQALIAEKEIIELRNEKLRAEKIHRDKELANQTMNIVQKNRFLIRLNEELKRIQNSTDDKVVTTKIALIKKRIKKEIDNQDQERLFETYFEDVHAEFFKRLKEKYPQLSPKDLKLCAYIRMNISTKEIATLLNISYRGAEISRYRLRKKLELLRDVNLATYLSGI